MPVCAARSAGEPYPADFDELKAHLGEAVRRIGRGGSPVIVVNSDKDLEQESVDFDKRPVWRILIGGTKLSRGFTVEGLSVSYYRRRTKQAATLMQMGRWFGFRDGYKDLVRLYIGRNEQDRNMRLDLYEAFGAMVRDEEDFRGELERYSHLVDGVPQVTPRDIPPLVSQRLPWLKPEAANKMYNAELVTRRSPGVSVEARAYPESGPEIAHNYARMLPIFGAATELRELKAAAKVSFQAYTGVVTHTDLLSALSDLHWMTSTYFQPDLNFLEEAGKEGTDKRLARDSSAAQGPREQRGHASRTRTPQCVRADAAGRQELRPHRRAPAPGARKFIAESTRPNLATRPSRRTPRQSAGRSSLTPWSPRDTRT